MMKLSEKIIENLRKLRIERNLKQSTLGMFAGIDESQMSRIMNGQLNLSIDQLEEIASGLKMSVIDIITYPETYVPKSSIKDEEVEAVLMVKLKESKKHQILKSVFGDENFEVLNE